MTDRPLRPATDHRLGRPLPHQLANRTQAPPRAPESLSDILHKCQNHRVLATVSSSYPLLWGRSPTCYSPVRHFQEIEIPLTFDLHVLGTPPAFILSQDQTLRYRKSFSFSLLPDPVASVSLSAFLLNSRPGKAQLLLFVRSPSST